MARLKTEMCYRCGYLVDSIACADGSGSQATDGDISLCLNCGAPKIMRNGAWCRMTHADSASLSDEDRRELARCERARRQVIKSDLSKRGNRFRA